MTALPCPRCGYDCRENAIDSMKTMWLQHEMFGVTMFIPIRASNLCCDSCGRSWVYDHGLSLDGVGPERLVPVETNA